MIPANFPYKHSGNVELFDFYQSSNIANGTSAALISARIATQAQGAWITQLGLGIDNPAAFATSVWQVRVNGVASFYYSNIQDELGPFDDPRDISPIAVPSGAVIDVFVFNNGAAPRLYAARLRGFLDYQSSPTNPKG